MVHPPFVDRLVPDAQTAAWDDLGKRRAVGVCQHSMVGSLWGTDRWFRRGAQSNGLTDYGIGGATDGPGWDGVILRWNDPRGRAARKAMRFNTATNLWEYVSRGTTGADELAVSPNRAGWANGGSDGLEGDGPLFVRTFGVNAINRDLVSIERSDAGDIRTPVSPKQFEAICGLTAYWFDQAKVPWDQFPLNPAHGIVTHLLHLEFATKACPHEPVTSRIDEIQARVRAILKAGQAPEVPGEPLPPRPDHGAWPAGYEVRALAERFGVLTRHGVDGSSRAFRFDPKGVISNAWAARGAAEGLPAERLPRALDWWQLRAEAGREMDVIAFDGRWTLFRADRHVAWRWVE